jgi:1,4-dihydroxy-6-naphthoate synthase
MPVKLKELTLAHSPDADDAFMFYPLAAKKIDTGGLTFKQIASEIQVLNRQALDGLYEITAISFAAYPHIHQRYALTTFGSSMGVDYGPVLIAPKPLDDSKLSSARIAVPGLMTTACLCLQLYRPGLNLVEMPFDQIIEAVTKGSVDAGLLIHEGQLTYAKFGLKKIVDLGQWWQARTSLPLPLGGNVIRKDLGSDLISTICRILKESILYALAHRQEALNYAMSFAKGMPADLTDRYISMYVNDSTVDCGEIGRQALDRLFTEAYEREILRERVVCEFAD